MTRPEGFYTEEAVFLREVVLAKAARGSLTDMWVSTAAIAWPVALSVILAILPGAPAAAAAVRVGVAAGLAQLTPGLRSPALGFSKDTAGAAVGGAIGALLGPIGAMVGSGLGVYAARALSSSASDGGPSPDELAFQSSRITTARRVFAELQDLAGEDPALFRDEVERLFEELVEDRNVVG
jgi:hypothetical protein